MQLCVYLKRAFKMEKTLISVDDEIENGNPHLVGTSITVFDIVYACASDGYDSVLTENPELTKTDLHAVLQYCKNRLCDRDGGHCGGCSLRTVQDGFVTCDEYMSQYSEVRFTESHDVIYGKGQGIKVMPGKRAEFEKTWRGDDGWRIASKLINQIE